MQHDFGLPAAGTVDGRIVVGVGRWAEAWVVGTPSGARGCASACVASAIHATAARRCLHTRNEAAIASIGAPKAYYKHTNAKSERHRNEPVSMRFSRDFKRHGGASHKVHTTCVSIGAIITAQGVKRRHKNRSRGPSLEHSVMLPFSQPTTPPRSANAPLENYGVKRYVPG